MSLNRTNLKIFVAGHNGLVGSSVYRKLKKRGFKSLITIDKSKLDLRNEKKVSEFLKKHKPNAIINAAAKVGGIYANNTYKADFIFDTIAIQNHLIKHAHENNIKDLIFLGSSCIYPKNAKQPIKEDYLLTGELEKTNEPYAIAKIAGIKTCEAFNFQFNTNFKCLMPCNIYGPNDNYDLNESHFFPAIIRKVHEANLNGEKYIKLWGNGKSRRELMYVDDLADACIFFLKKKTKHSIINIGSGKEMTINDYANFVIRRINPNIKIKYINKNLIGMDRKLVSSKRANNYGWKSSVSLDSGFKQTYKEFKKNYSSGKK